jgi:hypothetical protein
MPRSSTRSTANRWGGRGPPGAPQFSVHYAAFGGRGVEGCFDLNHPIWLRKPRLLANIPGRSTGTRDPDVIGTPIVHDAGWITPRRAATYLRGAEAKRPGMAARPRRFASNLALPVIDQPVRPGSDETTGQLVRARADRLNARRLLSGSRSSASNCYRRVAA